MRLLESYGGNRDDQRLMDMVLELHTFIQSSPWPEEWLRSIQKVYWQRDLMTLETPSGKVLLESAEIDLKGMKDMLERSIG